MVREALHERATVLKVAPHLSYQMPIMLPIYKLWQVPVALQQLLPVLSVLYALSVYMCDRLFFFFFFFGY